MNQRTSFFLTLCLCTSAWLLLGIAELNASFKLEVNLAPLGSGIAPSYLQFLSENIGKLVWFFIPRPDKLLNPILYIFIACFFAPAIIVHISNSIRVQIICIWGTAALVLIDLLQVFSFQGGDIKGCDVCGFWFELHILFGIIMVFFNLAAQLFEKQLS